MRQSIKRLAKAVSFKGNAVAVANVQLAVDTAQSQQNSSRDSIAKNGMTPLHIAIKLRSKEIIKSLICNLSSNLNESEGMLITDAMKLMAEEMPEMVLPCM
jgi:ankyrin repeat protein